MTNPNLPAITNPTVNLPILTQPDEVREILEVNLDGIVPELACFRNPGRGRNGGRDRARRRRR